MDENEKNLVVCPSLRTIDGYCFALRDQFDLCFVVDGVDSQICGYFFTIDQVEQYDRVLQQQWIEELQRNCEQVDQVSLVRCSQIDSRFLFTQGFVRADRMFSTHLRQLSRSCSLVYRLECGIR